ncbi:MAG TPA: PBP1A family penicillin-binding protein, partial [Acidobacteriota bacterium]|nr:PBP1A family penicillin-binding protein [Acidobacteriota bacterium]
MIIRRITKRVPVSTTKRKLWLFCLGLVFLAGLVGFLFVAELYVTGRKIIDSHLNSQKWALPSTIYADAPIVYEGMPLKQSWLADYLQRLMYDKTEGQSVKVGQFAIGKDGMTYCRHALFDTEKDPDPVRLVFKGQEVSKIVNASTGEELPAVELEPLPISSLFGQEWEKRTLVRYDELPKHMVQAVVAIEDRRFYEHNGVDPRAILRATLNDLLGGKQLQGGSTITQQLVKNFYLTPERSVRRKLTEAMMALILERRLNKQQIIEMYLNEIYMGQRGGLSINGVGEASRLFFRKDVQHIDIPEAALLAGLIQAPNAYNPYRHPKEAKERRDTVLLAMKNMDVLSDGDYRRYAATPLVVYPFDSRINLAPYFGDVVKAQLLEKYNENKIYNENLHVFTTLDLEMKGIAEEALSNGLAQIDKLRFKRTKQNVQGCLIAIEPQTGYIRAFVGGRSYSRSQFDRISQASRQPGSVFKPVVYAAAMEQYFAKDSRIFTPATLEDDEPWVLEYDNQTWEPKNYDGEYHGIVTLRKALAQSMNVATAKLAIDVGLNPIAALGRTLGFDAVKPYPSIALGAFEVSPWQVATAYTVFANGGVKTELRTIKKVTDTAGKTLERSQIEVKRVLHPQTAYILTDMMQTVMNEGTGAPARRFGFTRTAAGKTGTTDEYRDAWFVGYTPNLLCVVWSGYDDNTPIKMT